MKTDFIHPKAFSIIEVLIAVSIIGIIAAIVIPTYTSHIHKIRSRTAATELSAAFDLTKQYAKAYNQDIEISFYAESAQIKGYQIGTQLNPADKADSQAKILDEKQWEFYLPISTVDEIRKIGFNPHSPLTYFDENNDVIASTQNCTISIGEAKVILYYISGKNERVE